MKKKSILYVHGYHGHADGKSASLIKKEFSDFDVYSINYDETNCETARETISKFIYENNIDICIGSSMGGFILLSIDDIAKIVINPCMNFESSYKLIDMSKEHAETFIKYDNKVVTPQLEDKCCTIGIFGRQDSLFGDKFVDVFRKSYNNPIIVDCDHHLDESIIGTIREQVNILINNIDLKRSYELSKDNLPMYDKISED